MSYYSQNNGYPNNGMFQQQQQLPVDPTQIQSQPVPVSPGNPHFVPPVNVPQQIHQFLPLITSVVIMEIQNKSQQNALRVFMFNLYSRGQYNNPEFSELVEICANYIHLAMMNSREHNSIEGAIFGIVPNIVTMMACAQIKPFPALVQYLPQDLQTSAMNGTRALESIVRDITGGTRQHQGGFGNQMQMPNRGHMGGTVATMAAGSVNGHGLFGNGFTNNQPQNPVMDSNRNTGASVNRYKKQLAEQNVGFNANQQQPQQPYSTMFNNQPATPQQSSSTFHKRTVADLVGNNGAIKQPFQQRDPATVEEVTFSPSQQSIVQPAQVMEIQPNSWFNEDVKQENMVSNEQTVTLYSKGGLPNGMKWTRSNEQPYHPIWDPLIQRVMYTITNDNKVIAIIEDLLDTEKDHAMMEYEKHVIGKIPPSYQVMPVEQTSKRPPIVNTPPVTSVIPTIKMDNECPLLTSNVSSAVNSVLLKSRLGKQLALADACMVKSILISPLFLESKELETEFRVTVLLLSDNTTFAAGYKTLMDLSKKGKEYIYPHIDKILTERINAVLTLELGLEVTIDEFKDTVDLSNALEKAYGSIVAEALRNNEATILKKAVGFLGEEDTKNYTRQIIGNGTEIDDTDTRVVYNTIDCAFVALKSSSYDLHLTDAKGKTTMVTETGNKALHDLITVALKMIDRKYYYTYLVTSDGVVFETAYGFLNKETILIRQV